MGDIADSIINDGLERMLDDQKNISHKQIKNKYNNIMIKTATITEIHGAPKFWEKNNVYYHNLTMSNGDKINIGKKKQMVTGWEITYELTGEDDGQQEFVKAKSAQKQEANTYTPPPNNPSSVESPDKRQESIIRQTCIKAASELLSGSSRNTAEEVIKEAEKLEQWVNR